MSKNPVTLAELRERGMDEHMSEVISKLVGETTPARVRGKISIEDMWALGYGPPCACGERGLSRGETECRECPEDDEDAPEQEHSEPQAQESPARLPSGSTHMDVSIHHRLLDQLTRPAERAAGSLDRIREAVQEAASDSKRVLLSGKPVDEAHREIDPATGMQKDYVVLTPEERAKGFVRPVRMSYRHVGPPGPKNLRDLTDEERERHKPYHYVKFEPYPPERSPITGKFWTQAELDRVGKGCGTVTTMNRALAETCARQPSFYSGTFCAGCRTHLPVGENGEFVWEGTNERVGT